MNFYGIAALCIAAAVLCVLLRQYRPEFAVTAGIAAGVAVMYLLLGYAVPAVEEVRALADSLGDSAQYISVPLKSLGICYIGQFAGDVCRDAGQTSLAGKVDLASRLAVLIICIPLISAIMDIVKQLVV